MLGDGLPVSSHQSK